MGIFPANVRFGVACEITNLTLATNKTAKKIPFLMVRVYPKATMANGLPRANSRKAIELQNPRTQLIFLNHDDGLRKVRVPFARNGVARFRLDRGTGSTGTDRQERFAGLPIGPNPIQRSRTEMEIRQ